jgi:hypothetical protein
MLQMIIRSFARSLGWQAGKQASRAIGWLLWPLLLGAVLLVLAGQAGMLPPEVTAPVLDLVR